MKIHSAFFQSKFSKYPVKIHPVVDNPARLFEIKNYGITFEE